MKQPTQICSLEQPMTLAKTSHYCILKQILWIIGQKTTVKKKITFFQNSYYSHIIHICIYIYILKKPVLFVNLDFSIKIRVTY